MSVSAEKTLYRILQGRLLFKRGDLVLFIHEPTQELMYESYQIYDEVYEKAYINGVYIDEEVIELLISNNLWTPLDDREADKLDKEIENHKVEAFENFYQIKSLQRIKNEIKQKEKRVGILRAKRHYFDYITCEGIASYSRWNWLIAQSTYCGSELYNWEELNLSEVMSFYDENSISNSEYRYIARHEPWRSMWVSGKNKEVFPLSSSLLNKDQLALCMFSTMYDNVYEHPEAPDDKVIDDDICLDGWFISQRRKREKEKKEKSTEELIRNPRIANSPEIFIMAPDRETAQNIQDLNDIRGKAVIQQRDQIINSKGKVKDIDFFDVQQDLEIKKNQAIIQHVKGK